MTQYKKIPSLCFLVLAMKSVHIDDDDGHRPVSQVMGTAVHEEMRYQRWSPHCRLFKKLSIPLHILRHL